MLAAWKMLRSGDAASEVPWLQSRNIHSITNKLIWNDCFRRGKTWAIAFRRFSKFGHSSEFRVFSLEHVENLVLNLRPGSVY